MNQAIGYLREVLSRYVDQHEIGEHIYYLIENYNFAKDKENPLIRHLTTEEIEFLNQILPKEIEYANQEQDELRAKQLNEIYELLY